MAIQVSQAVKDGIEAVRMSGRTNMLDYNMVMKLAYEMEYHETVNWMVENKKAYAEGLFKGFEVIEVEK